MLAAATARLAGEASGGGGGSGGLPGSAGSSGGLPGSAGSSGGLPGSDGIDGIDGSGAGTTAAVSAPAAAAWDDSVPGRVAVWDEPEPASARSPVMDPAVAATGLPITSDYVYEQCEQNPLAGGLESYMGIVNPLATDVEPHMYGHQKKAVQLYATVVLFMSELREVAGQQWSPLTRYPSQH